MARWEEVGRQGDRVIVRDESGNLWPLAPEMATSVLSDQLLGSPATPGPRATVTPMGIAGAAESSGDDLSSPELAMTPVESTDHLAGGMSEAPPGPLPQAPPRPPMQRVVPPSAPARGSDEMPPPFVTSYTPPTEGQWTPGSSQRSGITDAEQKKLERAYVSAAEKASKAAQSQADVETSINQRRIEMERVEASRLRDEADQRDMRAGELQAESDAVMAEIDAELADVREGRIDSTRLMRDNPVAAILGVIAAGLGGYASARTGGPNFAMQMLNAVIDRDIDDQRTELAQRRHAAGERRDFFTKHIAGRPDTERAYARALRLEATAAEARNLAAQEGLERIKPQLDQLEAAIQQEKNKNMAAVYAAAQRSVSNQYVPGTPGGVQLVPNPEFQARLMDAEARKKMREASTDPNEVRDYWGNVIGSPSKGAEVMNNVIVGLRTTEDTLDQLENMIRESSATGRAIGLAEYKALTNRVVQDIGKSVPGVMTDTDAAMYAEQIGGMNASTFAPERQLRIINQFRQGMRRGSKRMLEQAGLPHDFIDRRERLLSSE